MNNSLTKKESGGSQSADLEFKIKRTYINKDGTLCCDYMGDWE